MQLHSADDQMTARVNMSFSRPQNYDSLHRISRLRPFLDPTLGLMDCILRSKSCLSNTRTLSDPYPTPFLPKGSLYPSVSAPELLSGTPDHYSCLGLCPLQYLHPMSSLRIDMRTYSTSYQVDGTPSKFPILVRKFPTLIRMVPTLIRKSFGCSTRVVCL
jgi:hypothetical protein